jgi:hypothetical protein
MYILFWTSGNARRCSGGSQNEMRILGSHLALTKFRNSQLLAGLKFHPP